MRSTKQTALPGLRNKSSFAPGELGSRDLSLFRSLLTPSFLIVWAVWGLVSIVPFLIVCKQGTSFAWSDDWSIVPAITGAQPISLEWLWAQHNEHRIAIPKL